MRGWLLPLSAAIVLTSGFVIFLMSSEPAPTDKPANTETAPLPLERRKTVRNVAPDTIVQAPSVDTATLERLPAKEVPPVLVREKPPEPVTFSRPVVVAAGVLEVEGRRIILGGVEPVDPDYKCTDAVGKSWPCGRFALTDMRLFVRGRPIECLPPKDETAKEFVTRCQLAGFDMSAWLVLTGWAEPGEGLFSREMREAKLKKRGIWRESAP